MSHARLMPPPVKAFLAPYNHLRYRYPETWRRLVQMQETRDPCPEGLEMKSSLDSGMKKSASLPSVSKKPSKHRSDSEGHRRRRHGEKEGGHKSRRKKELTEEEKVSMLRRMNAFAKRNPNGGVAEGDGSYHHIVTCYERQQRTF